MHVTIHEAKTNLSSLIQMALDGKEVVIVRNNQPVVRLQALTRPVTKRKLGSLHDLVKSVSADFDVSLDDFQS